MTSDTTATDGTAICSAGLLTTRIDKGGNGSVTTQMKGTVTSALINYGLSRCWPHPELWDNRFDRHR